MAEPVTILLSFFTFVLGWIGRNEYIFVGGVFLFIIVTAIIHEYVKRKAEVQPRSVTPKFETGYCRTCKQDRKMTNAEAVSLPSGRIGLKGVCITCGGEAWKSVIGIGVGVGQRDIQKGKMPTTMVTPQTFGGNGVDLEGRLIDSMIDNIDKAELTGAVELESERDKEGKLKARIKSFHFKADFGNGKNTQGETDTEETDKSTLELGHPQEAQ